VDVRAGWLPWSSASLACGAVLTVLGALTLPSTAEVGQVVEAVRGEGAAWVMASASFFLASIGLTMGLPAILWLFPSRHHTPVLVGLWIWSVGTIGTAGVAALLILFRATVQTAGVTPAEVEELSQDPSLRIGLLAVVGAFYLGEFLVAVLLLRWRVVARWVPGVMLAHIAVAPVNDLLPPEVQAAQSVLLGIGLVGVAVKSTESWAESRTPTAL
jgi:hypothetical protein